MYDLPIILVNEQDEPIGTAEKMQVHEQGILHRAFSIFIFSTDGALLLQQRSLEKYHSPGLWTNTCCGHGTPSETTEESASRRLMEEMGMHVPLTKLFVLHYVATFDNTLVENEIDHVYIGITNMLPSLDPAEAMNYRYAHLHTIRQEVIQFPELYTPWFRIIMDQHYDELVHAISAIE